MITHQVNENSGCRRSSIWMCSCRRSSEKLSEMWIGTQNVRTLNEEVS